MNDDEKQAEAAVHGLAQLGRYKCPTGATQVVHDLQTHRKHTIIGCGHEFDATPDSEGLVDCPNCGIWFSIEKEPDAVIIPVPYFRRE